MILARLGCLLATGAALCAQGERYAFAERAPRTPLERLVASRLASVVKVHGASGLSTITPYATGVVVSERGHVLTLDLVMLQPDRTRVVLADGSVHDARLLQADARLGVRMLQIDTSRLAEPLVPLTPATDLPPSGTFVVSIGNCFRLAEYSEKLSATFGVIVATARTGLRYMMSDLDYDGRLLITDAPNNPGHSGGALFALDGSWVGLNARVVESTETNTQISAAIPATDLAGWVAQVVHGDPIGDPIGDAAVDAPARAVHHGVVLFDRGGRRSPPAYVERVEADSPAHRLGLRPDDLVVRIDEYSIRSCAEFRATLQRFAPGDEIEVTWKRGSAVHRGRMTLGEAR